MKTALRPLYHVWHCGDETGEVEGVFDGGGNLLHWWACNDASLRPEYMAPLFHALGYQLLRSSKASDDLLNLMIERLDKAASFQ